MVWSQVLCRLSAMRRVEEAVVEGWCSVEELVRWGFGHAPVVMANEAHSGLARCIRTRETGIRMIRAAHEAGVRRLATEALPWPARDVPGPIRAVPAPAGGYLAQPDMRRLIAAALELGWSLWAYEAVFEVTADSDPAEFRSMEFTNWREREQAANLCRLATAATAEPLLVWCGNSHASKSIVGDWTPMGWHFRAMSGINPFVIDQNVTVTFDGQPSSGCSRCWQNSVRRWPPTTALPESSLCARLDGGSHPCFIGLHSRRCCR
jgi:hypothetical protein